MLRLEERHDVANGQTTFEDRTEEPPPGPGRYAAGVDISSSFACLIRTRRSIDGRSE